MGPELSLIPSSLVYATFAVCSMLRLAFFQNYDQLSTTENLEIEPVHALSSIAPQFLKAQNMRLSKKPGGVLAR